MQVWQGRGCTRELLSQGAVFVCVSVESWAIASYTSCCPDARMQTDKYPLGDTHKGGDKVSKSFQAVSNRILDVGHQNQDGLLRQSRYSVAIGIFIICITQGLWIAELIWEKWIESVAIEKKSLISMFHTFVAFMLRCTNGSAVLWRAWDGWRHKCSSSLSSADYSWIK